MSTTPWKIRLTPVQIEQLKVAAEQERRSVTQQVAVIIEEWLAAYAQRRAA
jgi:hypothetical protein